MVRVLVDWLAPANCHACGRPGSGLCADCRSTAITPHPASCWGCNRLSPGWRTCQNCRRHNPIKGIVVGARYDGAVKELVLGLKFGRDLAAARAAASLLAPLLAETQFDAVTSVPSAPGRYRRRGYNPSALIARQLAAQLALPYRELLGRLHHAEQIGARRQERFAQVEGAFYARGTAAGRVLVVDDVLTTGATLGACARALRTAGAREVWGAAAAKH